MYKGYELGTLTRQIDSLSPTDSVSSLIYEGNGLSGGKFFETNFIYIRGLSQSSVVYVSLSYPGSNILFPY